LTSSASPTEYGRIIDEMAPRLHSSSCTEVTDDDRDKASPMA
jgi:hypothetical protein